MRFHSVAVVGLTIGLSLPGGQVAGSGPAHGQRYRAVEVRGAQDLGALRSELGDEGMHLLQKLNRRDEGHLARAAVLVVPDSGGSLLDHSPFPQELPDVASLPKLLLVSLRVQAFAAYELGRQIHWGPVNSGSQKHPTPPTLYHANWRAPRRVSSIDPRWIMHWYVNIHTGMGLALHQYTLPGSPVSYGCIRLLREDAVWLYDWVDLWVSGDGQTAKAFGTPIAVFGEYDYDSPPPWTELTYDPFADRLSEEELGEVLELYVRAMERRTREREEYLASRSS